MDTRRLTDSARISRATLTTQLEEALRIDILEGVLEPGRRIRAHEMTARYGVSATPLREALQRLAVENLVDLDPRLGATVAPLSISDLRDIYEMLQLLDGLALERSIERGGQDWADALDHAFDRLTRAIAEHGSMADSADDETRRRVGMEWSSAHWDFHHALYAACGSEWLLRFVSQLHDHAERYRMRALRSGPALRDSTHQHEQMYLAAKRRDATTAVDALRAHLQLTVEVLTRALSDPKPAGKSAAR